jgi:predicted NAD-dependent protein-ADP-ribosyltransferase YbiA (DUF1768 family)
LTDTASKPSQTLTKQVSINNYYATSLDNNNVSAHKNTSYDIDDDQSLTSEEYIKEATNAFAGWAGDPFKDYLQSILD